MGRFLLIAFVGFGFLSAMLGRVNSSHSSSGNDYFAKARAQQVDAYEEAQKANQPTVISSDGTVELNRNDDGHFYADVQINGATVRMLVDTGASTIALSREDARNAGIATSIGMNDVVGEGADGNVYGEFIKIDRMSLGPKEVDGLDGIILNNGSHSLLGQSFLAKFASVEIHGDTMVLR
jgi:aspartyl protease family protein